ncbi:hypothetical protein AMATHDRAFT_8852 [Amanita thiersii Skay4041]|uniref:DUF6533 domain-containing protein n=1 Tax=Amanita thiersii Skay4041 TaxID=703135 RepID=A0A2A9N7U2_9AGAR|nr:hypothetical protein AMATHDRAFT_8852 [Amanita thiersii Skay4041]
MADLFAILLHLQIVHYIDVSAAAILVYDYLLTIRMEIEYVWKAKWTLIKITYVIMRYMPFLSVIAILIIDAPGLTPTVCVRLTRFYSFIVTIDVIISECKPLISALSRTRDLIHLISAILTLRTWAVYGHNFKMGVVLLALYLAMAICGTINMVLFLTTLQYAHFFQMCIVTGGSRRLIVNWLVLVAYDAVTCGLLAFKAYHSRAHALSPINNITHSHIM